MAGVDGFAPNGIASLSTVDGQESSPSAALQTTSTIIEVRYRLSKSNIPKLLQVLNGVAETQHASGILIVVGRLVVDSSIVHAMLQTPPVYVWGLSHVESLLNTYLDAVVDLIPELRESGIRQVVAKSKNASANWLKANEQHLRDLKQAYLRDQLTLFCGAGISIAAGVPSWNTLISRLMNALLYEDVSVSSSEELGALTQGFLTANGSSPLLTARYIRKGLGEDFRVQVSTAMYRSPIDIQCRLLQQLSQLCQPRRNGLGIRSVITFNFDSLLEEALKERGITTRSIYRDGIVPSPDELPIYHVHGFIPRDADIFEGVQDTPLIFSEEEYHQVFRDAYSWSNIVQLNHLRETTCLLVGLSLTDPNLRRLLDIAASQSGSARHYVLFQRTASAVLAGGSSLPNEMTDQALNFHHEMMTNTLASLGLNVIWYESHEEIPDLLQRVYK